MCLLGRSAFASLTCSDSLKVSAEETRNAATELYDHLVTDDARCQLGAMWPPFHRAEESAENFASSVSREPHPAKFNATKALDRAPLFSQVCDSESSS